MHKKPLILKRLKALKQFLLSKDSRNQILKQAVHTLYLQEETPKQKIPTYPPADILPITTCSLQPIALQDGNLSLKELLTLTAFLQAYRPKNLLEIGTFNGATTLHMALNTPAQSTIHTLDLSQVENYPQEALEPEDIKYISSPIKKEKLYHSTPYAPKIQEHIGNSLTYPFTAFGPMLDFVFIDGGHSYAVVKNDSEKSLACLSQGGILLWHDYTPHCEGVYTYLNELAEKLPLYHLEGTSFACFSQSL